MVAADPSNRRRPLVLVPFRAIWGHACRSSPAWWSASPSRGCCSGGSWRSPPSRRRRRRPTRRLAIAVEHAHRRRPSVAPSATPASGGLGHLDAPRPRRSTSAGPPPSAVDPGGPVHVDASTWRPSCPASTSRLDRDRRRPSPRSPELGVGARPASARRRRLRRHAGRGLARPGRDDHRAAGRAGRCAGWRASRPDRPGAARRRDPDRPDRGRRRGARPRRRHHLPRRPRPAVGDVPARRRPGPPRDDVPCRPRRSLEPAEILAARVPEVLGTAGLAVRRAQGAVGRLPRPPGRRPGRGAGRGRRPPSRPSTASCRRTTSAHYRGRLVVDLRPRTAGGKREAFEELLADAATGDGRGVRRRHAATPTGSRSCARRADAGSVDGPGRRR